MDMHPRGQACWHPPQPQHDFLSGSKFIFVENREKKVEGSAWLARLSAPARRNRRASKVGNKEKNHEWTRMHTKMTKQS